MEPTSRTSQGASSQSVDINTSNAKQKYTKHCPNSSSQRRIGIIALAILLLAAMSSFILIRSQTPSMRFVSLSSGDSFSALETTARVRSCNSFLSRDHSCRSVKGGIEEALRDFSTRQLPSNVAWEVMASSSTVVRDGAAMEDFCGQASSGQQIVASMPVEQDSPASLDPSLLCIRQSQQAQQVVQEVLATPGSGMASKFTNAIRANEQVRDAVRLVDPVSSRVNTRYGADTGALLRPGAAAQDGDPVMYCPPNDGPCLESLIEETTVDNHFG